MADQENYDKFIQDVQRKIDDADRLAKQNAEARLKMMADDYRAALSTRLDYELATAEKYRRAGDELTAKHHDALASVYNSLLVTADSR